MFRVLIFTLLLGSLHAKKVQTGLETLLETPSMRSHIEKKRIGLLTHNAAITSQLETSWERIAREKNLNLKALFCPEHGLDGSIWAEHHISHSTRGELPVYSLHGAHRRPTKEMLGQIDVLIADLQDIGTRSYTYISTLCYVMEEAAKANIPLIVCDRPNPMGGLTVDGPMLEKNRRSIVGYINVPYCHGMTMGELARYFNLTQKINCKLTVIPMKGYNRSMTFQETGLTWIPTSPNIPEPDTPLYYPITGIIGELGLANIGIGSPLPFKVVGAPWIDAAEFVKTLRKQNLPGISFIPFHYVPFHGSLKGQKCHGALLRITNSHTYQPVKTAYLMLSILKSHAPKAFKNSLAHIQARREMFAKINGTDKICELLLSEKHPGWKMIEHYDGVSAAFKKERAPYLIYP